MGGRSPEDEAGRSGLNWERKTVESKERRGGILFVADHKPWEVVEGRH